MSEHERIALSLSVNGQVRDLTVAPSATLLDLLRDQLCLTGTKKACDMGACGACTVLAQGRRITSCLALAASYDGAVITTIEGIGTLDDLHPLLAAFIRHDALQCGYCTPGRMLSGIALLAEKPKNLSAIRDGMSGISVAAAPIPTLSRRSPNWPGCERLFISRIAASQLPPSFPHGMPEAVPMNSTSLDNEANATESLEWAQKADMSAIDHVRPLLSGSLKQAKGADGERCSPPLFSQCPTPQCSPSDLRWLETTRRRAPSRLISLPIAGLRRRAASFRCRR